MLTGPERRRLLKAPLHLLTDDQLRAVAPYAMIERLDVDQGHRLLRELRRRFGLSNLEISKETGFRPHVVFAAMRNRPPLPGVRVPR